MSDEKLDPNSDNLKRYAYNIIDSSHKEKIDILFAMLEKEYMKSGKIPALETSPSSGKDLVETDLLNIKIEKAKEGTSNEQLEQEVVIEVNEGNKAEQNSDSKERLPVKFDESIMSLKM
ncbi:unnamed protein product [[Candida] boidinii]|nr:unnamed protein product [[Candida] boidinii]